ncbi:glycosyltransferase [Pedobacter lithocola]|uniref:Glycosyltransferase n=1 Tax=Pedobacter lithocola TaxID=1908239 RepID=A0ABV8P7F9_9SPHI
MDKISVLTLVYGRKEALKNFLSGLKTSTQLPDELVIVFMNEPICDLPEMPFLVRCFQIFHENKIPLAAARNKAAKAAQNNLLIFLDVDCIPSKTLISTYAKSFESQKLLVGTVRYLNNGATEQDEFLAKLELLSKPDPIRSDLYEIPYELFWSLNFACHKIDYDCIGGFDENFQGYGAEDTDFSFAARRKHVKLKMVDACAYHQYHPSYSPPLNHFKDIVLNAERFFMKWNIWPMEGWLKQFIDMGLISKNADHIEILRYPSGAEVEAALKD